MNANTRQSILGWLAALASAAAATLLSAMIYSLVFLKSERSREVAFGILYAFFAMIALPWIQPYAALTVRKNGWMTRG